MEWSLRNVEGIEYETLKDKFENNMTKIATLLGKYKTTSFLESIRKCIPFHIIDRDFATKKNNKPYHIPTGDGKLLIIDHKTGNITIRDRTQSDLYTECIKGCYDLSGTCDKPIEFFSSMFIKEEKMSGEIKSSSYIPDPEGIKYIQQVLGLSFLGVNI